MSERTWIDLVYSNRIKLKLKKGEYYDPDYTSRRKENGMG